MRNLRKYTTLTITGSLLYVITIWLLHGARPELQFDQSYVSNFLEGRLGWVAIIVFWANAYGAWVLPRALVPLGIQEHALISRLLRTFAVGYAIAAVTMQAPVIHGITAYMTFLSLPLAAILVWARQRNQPSWKRQARTSLILGIVQLWSVLFAWQAFGVFVGERVLILSEITWLVWFAFIVRSKLGQSSSRQA